MYTDNNTSLTFRSPCDRKVYILITIVITSYLLSACAAAGESHSQPFQADPAEVSRIMAEAENLFKQREDTQKLREANAMLSRLRNPDNRNYEVEWKFARYSYFLGKQAETEAESDKALENGRDAASIASRIEPGKVEGHFWYAANLGELARKSPITIGLRSVDDIREAMNKVIEIQPDYQGASAYDALGQLELRTRLTSGKPEKAVEFLEKGMAIAPENANIRLHLAEAYFAVKKDAEAKKQLDDLIKMKPHPDYSVEHARAVEEAKKLIEKRF